MKDNARKFSLAIFVAILVCFLMPFLDLSCGEQKIVNLTGLELITGKTIADSSIYGVENNHTHPHLLVILASLCSIAGFVFVYVKGKSRLISSALSLLGFVFLLKFKILMDGNIAEKGDGMIFADWRYGFWLACVLFILASVICLVAYYREKSKTVVSGTMISCFAVFFVALIGYNCNSNKTPSFRELAKSDASWDLHPIWHPQKNIVIFERWDENIGWNTYQLNMNDFAIARFKPASNFDDYNSIDWFSDGNSFVFWTGGNVNAPPKIWRYDSNNQVSELADNAAHPCWINNYKSIIYMDTQRGDSIWLMDGNGNNKRLLIKPGSAPDCMADGEWFVYNSRPSRDDFRGNIYAFNIASQQMISITNSDNAKSASFSFDGKKVVYVRIVLPEKYDRDKEVIIESSKYQIVVVDFPSLENERVIFESLGIVECTPTISPNSKHLAWCHSEGGRKFSHIRFLEL